MRNSTSTPSTIDGLSIVFFLTIPIWGSAACCMIFFTYAFLALLIHAFVYALKKILKFFVRAYEFIFMVDIDWPACLPELGGKPIVTILILCDNLMMMLCDDDARPIHAQLQTNTQVVFHAPDFAA